ncbi:hypothetical protein QJS10_CPB14g00510 [Acorus calamus]|uniref:Uncharacterized protein n=1 Tax=Acorus calamus TaxID=4465 RepID=A0AAV9DB20_ACOCL|nr:hypothetical protein QJS10_CPB14g00510 [Acorus calamus]
MLKGLFNKKKKNKEEKSHWGRWRLKFLTSIRWRRLDFHVSFFDEVLFRILSVLEFVFLLSTLCFFYLCFGCHF